jgi:hypothetical protein
MWVFVVVFVDVVRIAIKNMHHIMRNRGVVGGLPLNVESEHTNDE